MNAWMNLDDMADEQFDKLQQRLADAFSEGMQTGSLLLSINLNPFYPLEPEHREWVRGWREGMSAVMRTTVLRVV